MSDDIRVRPKQAREHATTITIVIVVVKHFFCYSCRMAETNYRDAVCSQVAKLLRLERERQGVSMTRLAEMSGLSQGMISLVEHEHRNPSLETLLRICHALKIELSTVLARAERTAKKGVSG